MKKEDYVYLIMTTNVLHQYITDLKTSNLGIEVKLLAIYKRLKTKVAPAGRFVFAYAALGTKSIDTVTQNESVDINVPYFTACLLSVYNTYKEKKEEICNQYVLDIFDAYYTKLQDAKSMMKLAEDLYADIYKVKI